MSRDKLACLPTQPDERPDGFIQPTAAEVEHARDAVAQLQWNHVTESVRRKPRQVAGAMRTARPRKGGDL